MKSLRVLASPALFLCIATSSMATTIDLWTGTLGEIRFGQSFNETRGVDVTVQGADAQGLSSMTLAGLNVNDGPATLGARVYDSSTQALIASTTVPVPMGGDQTITVPVSA